PENEVVSRARGWQARSGHDFSCRKDPRGVITFRQPVGGKKTDLGELPRGQARAAVSKINMLRSSPTPRFNDQGRVGIPGGCGAIGKPKADPSCQTDCTVGTQ